MIIDNVCNLERYVSVVPQVHAVADYLRNTEIGSLKPGLHYLSGGDVFLYCFEYESKLVEECMGEAHYKYLDLHLIVSGSETIGILDGTADSFGPYDSANDYCAAKGRFRYIDLATGDFVIFLPQEGHMTGGHRFGCPSTNVKRVVFKLQHTL